MDAFAIQQQIISHFWSKSFKEYIEETGHHFSNSELMSLIWQAIPEYQERLQLLQQIADSCPAVSDHAKLCINFMEKVFYRFKQHSTNEIYELRIVEQNRPVERYLCDSYETALTMIDGFWEEYSFSHEKPTTRYVIVKRSILHMSNTFQEDELGYCELGPGKVLLSAHMNDLKCEFEPCDSDCMECSKTIIDTGILFPPFLPNLSLVQYRCRNKVELGITFEPGRNDISDRVFVVPLSNWVDPGSWDHEHVPHWDVDIQLESDLSEQQKEQANILIQFLENFMATGDS